MIFFFALELEKGLSTLNSCAAAKHIILILKLKVPVYSPFYFILI